MSYADFFQLKGAVISEMSVGDDVSFETSIGHFFLSHYQDCCESVHLEKTIGDVENVLNSPILTAENDYNEPPGEENRDYSDSHTWSRYRLVTAKGEFEMYFLGESNGYYSETMTFEKLD